VGPVAPWAAQGPSALGLGARGRGAEPSPAHCPARVTVTWGWAVPTGVAGMDPRNGAPGWSPERSPGHAAQAHTGLCAGQGPLPATLRSRAAAPTAQGAGGREGRGGREPGAGDDGHHRDRRVMPRAPVQPLKTRWWVDLGWALVPTQPLCHCPPQLGKGEKTRQKARGWRSGQGDHSASTLTGKTGSTRGN